MGKEFTDVFGKWLTIATLVTVIVVGLVVTYPNWRRSQSLRLQNAELQEQIDAKKREIERMRDYQRRFRTDPDFVEMIARQNHRVYPGELIFLFNDKD